MGFGTVTSHWPRACISLRPASSARSSGGSCVTCVRTRSASHTTCVVNTALSSLSVSAIGGTSNHSNVRTATALDGGETVA